MSIPDHHDEVNQQRSPKKRALSDINNTYSDQSFKKKDNKGQSLDFDMARIDLPSDIDSHTFKTHIPSAPSGSLFALKNMAEKNRRSSHIPAPVNYIRPDLNIQHINKLIGVNQNLSKKPLPDEKTDSKPSLRTRLSNVEQTFSRDLTRQSEINHDLDSQVKELASKVDELEYELLDLKRSLKKIGHRLADLKQTINSQKKKFEFMEDSVMKNVLHKEQLINVQIKDLANKLNTEYNEVKFQLQDELAKAKSYKDKGTIDDIRNLNSHFERLQNQLDETKSRKQQTLKSETTELEKQLDKYLLAKIEEVDKLTNIYQQRQSEHDAMLVKIKDIKDQIKLKENENNSLKESICTIESNMNNFTTIRSSLLSDLQEEENVLINLETKNREWDKNLATSQMNYKMTFDKMKKHRQQRRTIENSIMDYLGKIRVYIKGPNSTCNNEEIEHNNRFFKFNKCFSSNISNCEIIEDYKALINSSISGNNCSVIFSGSRSNDLVINSITSIYQSIVDKAKKFEQNSWEFKYYLKCITTGKTSSDLLSSLFPISFKNFEFNLSDIPSQKMLIEDTPSLKEIVSCLQMPQENEGAAYIIHVDATNSHLLRSFDSNILLLDITNIQYTRQNELIRAHISNTPESSDLMNLLRYAYLQSKCLHISSLNSITDCEIMQFLKNLEMVNSTDSPYKRTN